MMQLHLPLEPQSSHPPTDVRPSSPPPSPPPAAPKGRRAHVVAVGATMYEVEIARHARARRYVLRMPSDGSLRLTVPRGASIEGGLAFARKQTAWIEREQARLRRRVARVEPGGSVWWRGEQVQVVSEAGRIRFANEIVAMREDATDLKDPILAHLFTVARRELPARCLQLAAPHRVVVSRVSVRNQRSRWGSCSPEGAIALNWRLVQMPPNVSDYIILHELMHVRQPNHSRRFWREVEGVCPWWRDAERWIRRHGREIL